MTNTTIASEKGRIYLGTYAGERSARGRRCFVLGFQFGPMLYAIGCDESEALDEFDERLGDRVEPDEFPEADFEKALADGEIRINDGGTVVHVDHYEWIHEFRNFREAWTHFHR